MGNAKPGQEANLHGRDWEYWFNRWLDVVRGIFHEFVDSIVADSGLQLVWVVHVIDGNDSVSISRGRGLPFEQLRRDAIAEARKSISGHQARGNRVEATFFGFNGFDVAGKLGSGRSDSFWVERREGVSQRFTARKRMFGSWDEGGDVTTESEAFPENDF